MLYPVYVHKDEGRVLTPAALPPKFRSQVLHEAQAV